jgi:hypothetical protein
VGDKKVVEAHEQTQRVEEHAIFPSHEQRTESELFRHNKHKLVHDMNLPCFKCNIKHNGNPPPSAYEHREVHHGLVEWSAWHAVDPAKVQTLLDGGFFDPYGFAKQMHGQPFESPDNLRNLIVLCATCHRSEGVGIHHATMPEWMSDMVALDGVDILLTKDEWNLLVTLKAVIAEDGHLVLKESI